MSDLREIVDKQRDPAKKDHVWWVGEQVLDICGDHPKYADIVAQDLESGAKIADIEKKIAAYARANGGCTPPNEAERIIMEFFGLTAEPKADKGVIDLADFF